MTKTKTISISVPKHMLSAFLIEAEDRTMLVEDFLYKLILIGKIALRETEVQFKKTLCAAPPSPTTATKPTFLSKKKAATKSTCKVDSCTNPVRESKRPSSPFVTVYCEEHSTPESRKVKEA